MSFFGGVCFNALGCVWIFGWWVDLQHEEVEMMTRLKKIYEALMGVQSSEFRPHILQLTPTKNKNKHADPSKKKECTSRSYIYIYYINHHLIKDCYRDCWSIPSPLAQFYHFGYCFHVFFFRTWNPRQWADLWPWTLTANAWPKRTKRTWGKKGRDTLITSLWPVCAIEEVVF